MKKLILIHLFGLLMLTPSIYKLTNISIELLLELTKK
jgi:hypothetical protein